MTLPHYGLIRKLTVNLNLVDGQEFLPLLIHPQSKYVGSKQDGSGKIKYYTHGFKILSANEFLMTYNQRTIFRPRTDHVALISLASDVRPNNNQIMRDKNKTVLLSSVEITKLSDGFHHYIDPGLSFDFKSITMKSAAIDIFNGKVELACTTLDTREYIEEPEDVVNAMRMVLDPFISALDNFVAKSYTSPYGSEKGSALIIDYVSSILDRLGIYTEAASTVRKILGSRLIDSSYKSGGSGEIKSMVSGGAGVDDVMWDSQEDYEFDLRQEGGDIERTKMNRRNQLRMKFLIDDCTFERRLEELTEEEINNTDLDRPNITYAMKPYEVDEWLATENKAIINDLEKAAKDRWKAGKEKAA